MRAIPYAALSMSDLVAERGRLTRTFVEAEEGGADTRPAVDRLMRIEAVLMAREVARVLSRAQQAARWAEVLAEHEPARAQGYAARAQESAGDALTLAAELRGICAAAAVDEEAAR